MLSDTTVRLASYSRLTETDRGALEAAFSPPKWFEPREVVASEGQPADRVIVVLSGWAARCKMLRSGERQIVGFLLPGDATPIYPGVIHRRTDAIWALTRCKIIEGHTDAVEALTREHPVVDQAFRRAAMIEAAVLQEWLANLGRRSAGRRLAHLFCELWERLRAIGMSTETGFPLPITQTILGDALGLSPAHVNRTLQSLRASNLAVFEAGEVTINNPERLKTFSAFDPGYLGLEPR